jgi:hypothetical protein
LALLLVVGCATRREVTISAKPSDAIIRADGQDLGRGRVTEEFVFRGDDVHNVVISRPGFRDQVVTLRRDDPSDLISVELRPLSRRVTLRVVPAPAIVSVDGRAITPAPVSQVTTDLDFWQDSRNNWNTHTVTADREGYQPVKQTIGWSGQDQTVILDLQPMRKDLNISSTPPGATVYLDDEAIGQTPLADSKRAFNFDPDANQYVPRKVRIEKPGFDPLETTVGWDEGRTDYAFTLPEKTKTVRIVPEPSGARVQIAGKEVPPGADGAVTARLVFPPVNETGQLPTYTAVVSKKTKDAEWEAVQLPITYDDGRTDYPVRLKEILTKPVPLTTAEPERGANGWAFVPRTVSTLAMKDVSEGAKKQPPVQVLRLAAGEQLDTLTLSPDGSTLLFVVLIGRDPADFRSQFRSVRVDGTGGVQQVSDGRALELMPSYTPDGGQIVFSSNRGGSRLSIWQMSAVGAPGITNLTAGDAYDLWPQVDSDPKPRLFYVRLVDGRADPRLYMTRLGTTIRTDLTSLAGTQPRVSPKADALVFTTVNEKTGKRDIYRMSDSGGGVQNLTNTPDADEHDPVYSRDGRWVAFVSDRGVSEDRRANQDIWIMDLARPDRPVQVTSNGSWDDCPVFDPTGQFIYFRSNRGGEWGIWRVAVK